MKGIGPKKWVAMQEFIGNAMAITHEQPMSVSDRLALYAVERDELRVAELHEKNREREKWKVEAEEATQLVEAQRSGNRRLRRYRAAALAGVGAFGALVGFMTCWILNLGGLR